MTVWIALSSSGINGPYFYEVGGETATVTSGRYLHILSNIMERREINALDIYFQQDGTAAHTANCVLEWLQETFEGNFIAGKLKMSGSHIPRTLTHKPFCIWTS